MVFPGEGDYMATARRSKKSLHNFSLPKLKWGSHRNLRCMKIDSSTGSNRNRRSSEEGIEEFREKMMSDLKTVADKMTESMFRKQALTYEEEQLESPEKKKREVSSPWNLRKRRAAPITEGLGIVEEKRVNSSKKEKAKFVSTLTKKEIEDDYIEMMGHRPPRRPKKRLRTIQKQVHMLYPAFYFTTEITQDIYKVPEATENVKR
ncbi:hypothetical protein AALP_AA2G104700 [Arabis alpina]|uniref:Uncharacterized protein n=1 Tax=Arabis alpina TaxID=50452 RepID=A0A087HGJ6_ARAAL|nr:hypothetical protein AALP_AA2G104700 [Arabis alpina]